MLNIVNYLRLALVLVSVVVGIAGAGWGWLKSQEAAGAAAQVAGIAKELEAEKTAHRASRAAARALAVRLKAAEELNKEKTANDELDKEALAEAKDWADQPLPEPIRLRLLDKRPNAPAE